jgi:hypothetical protein
VNWPLPDPRADRSMKSEPFEMTLGARVAKLIQTENTESNTTSSYPVDADRSTTYARLVRLCNVVNAISLRGPAFGLSLLAYFAPRHDG